MQADNNVLMAHVAHILFQREGEGGKVGRGRRGGKFGRRKYVIKEIRRPKGREAKAMDQALVLLQQTCRSCEFSVYWLMRRLTKENLQRLASSLIHAFGFWKIINSCDRKNSLGIRYE